MPFLFSRRPSTPGLLAALCLLATPPRALHSASSPATVLRPKITGRPAQLALAALVAAVAQSPLQAVEPAIASATMSLGAKSALAKKDPVKILMIGDSMSVGGFGDSMQEFLQRHYGRVALYASCGSSPESWLRGEPDFVTKCGYRATTPLKKYFTDFTDGHKPNPTVTPKLEDLLAYHTPSVVIIQLGTNWMDGLESKNFAAEEPKYRAILAKFDAQLRSARSVKQVFWIPPPDSSRYTSGTERNVEQLICTASNKYGYTEVKNGKPMTTYIAGQTGGDGVHYRNEDARVWAGKVEDFLRGRIR
ncbi:MAG TPA: hypothetical protein VGO11_22615 [Chthoniobacteraceae bacterium]|jgi:hypothetical protein|nr:hypothetical protein [Chthoniobacteraceae bacterium]